MLFFECALTGLSFNQRFVHVAWNLICRFRYLLKIKKIFFLEKDIVLVVQQLCAIFFCDNIEYEARLEFFPPTICYQINITYIIYAMYTY